MQEKKAKQKEDKAKGKKYQLNYKKMKKIGTDFVFKYFLYSKLHFLFFRWALKKQKPDIPLVPVLDHQQHCQILLVFILAGIYWLQLRWRR